MILYQLHCIGSNAVTQEKQTIVSKKVFKCKIQAEDYLETFNRKCTTPIDYYDWNYLSSVSRITIKELEFDEND